jgi:hypothetical protein
VTCLAANFTVFLATKVTMDTFDDVTLIYLLNLISLVAGLATPGDFLS